MSSTFDRTDYKTARGITTTGLDELDAAHRSLSNFQDQIVNYLRERDWPTRGLDDVLCALEALVSEPVR